VEEETYTPAEAAKILRLSKRRIIQLVTEEDLEGYKDENGRWRIPQTSDKNPLHRYSPAAEGDSGRRAYNCSLTINGASRWLEKKLG
jgi:excisionase family DNA binding protein